MTVSAVGDPEVKLEATKRDGMRVLVVQWSEHGATVTAEVSRVGDIPTLVKVTIENPRQLPADQRTVPTEARVLGMIQALGPDGWPYFLYLMGETLRHEGSLVELTEEVLLENLNEYRRSLFKRPHSRRPDLVDVAINMERRQTKTRDIVNALIAHGVSEATAFRYLNRARTALAREGGSA